MPSSVDHADEQRLLWFADGELDASEARDLNLHLDRCPECARRLASIRAAGELYHRYHGSMKQLAPEPPRPWADLLPRMAERNLQAAPPATVSLPTRPLRLARWLPVAAAFLVAAFILYRLQVSPSVSAAELLRKAEAAEPQHRPAERIQLRTRGRVVVRPAILRTRSDSDRELAALFAAAHYDYDNPLSARAYNAWRAQLAEKVDHVRTVAGGDWEIRTTTRSSPLGEAVLTLRAADLRPVRETMKFTDETVEIAEAGVDAAPTPQPAPAAPVTTAPPVPAPSTLAGPADELEVLVALHRVQADLGEPVEVIRQDGHVVVTCTGLTGQREEQIREALASLPRVELRLEHPVSGPMRSAATSRPAVADARRSVLGGRLGEDAVDRVLDAGEAVLARAFALRALARRFDPQVEAGLSPSGRMVLAGLREAHAAALARQFAELESTLLPVLPTAPVTAVPAAPTWQTAADRLLPAAQRVDQLLSRILAGGGEAANPADLSVALRQLEAETRAQPGVQ